METVIHTRGLSDLGYKIYLDRYALKDGSKESIEVGDLVVVCTNLATGQREVGNILSRFPDSDDMFTVRLLDGEEIVRSRESIDKPLETDPQVTLRRVARGVAAAEPPDARDYWEQRFFDLMDDWKFVPAGRILSAAGSDQNLVLYNCFCLPSPHDSRSGIVNTLEEMMQIMSRGGGVGMNISPLRPAHAYVRGVNGRSSGSVSWGALYSFATGLIEQGGSRRGALMLILNVWHPDILRFINAKREAGKITNANISVGITDAFMTAVRAGADWNLEFPDTADEQYDSLWDGNLSNWKAIGGKVIVYQTLPARDIWNAIVESAWASAEPGVYFIDTAEKFSNSWYYAPLSCTNPCGEQPLPDYGVCNLGAINLAKFVRVSDGGAWVDYDALKGAVRLAVRFLDDVIDVTPYFLEQNRVQQARERRVGLNTMGLAEAMLMMGIRYGSKECAEFIRELYDCISDQAYIASMLLAKEKGCFPEFHSKKYLESLYVSGLPLWLKEEIAEHGVRNVTLLTQAPTGTIGTMVGTSTGIEPFYSWSFTRKSRLGTHEERVPVYQEFRDRHGDSEPLPDYFVTAMDLAPEEHVRVQAAIQRYIDSAISKTCNVPNHYTVEQVRALYEQMYDSGCKGGTIYRDGSRSEQVLSVAKEEPVAPAAPVAAEPEQVEEIRSRPYKLSGATASKKSPSGTLHVTMNDDAFGNPFEVFIEIGKCGSELRAMSEAMGRLISLMLRMSSPVTPLARLNHIVGQLRGIGGSRSVGFGRGKVRSLPDGVAIVLHDHYCANTEAASVSLPDDDPEGEQPQPVAGDICPACGHATYVHTEGCTVCRSCGHSEC